MRRPDICLATFFSLLAITCFSTLLAKTQTDSLSAIWGNQSLSDSLRFSALAQMERNLRYVDPDSTIVLCELHYQMAITKHDTQEMANALRTQANVHLIRGTYNEALRYASGSLDLAIASNYKSGIASSYNLIGAVFDEVGDYTQSFENYSKALKVYQEIGERKGEGNCLNNMGVLFRVQGMYSNALEYYNRSLEIRKQIGDEVGIATSMNNIGLIYDLLQDYESALRHYASSLEISKKIGYQQLIGKVLNNMGIIYKTRGDYDSALHYFNESLKIKEATGHSRGIAVSLNNIGDVHAALGNYREAIRYSTRALDIAQGLGAILEIQDAAYSLYMAFKETGQPEKALQMHELYILMRDSVLDEENQNRLIQAQYRNAYEKQALEDSLDYAQKETVKNLELEKQAVKMSRQRIALASGAVALLLLVALAFAIYRGKRSSDHLLLNILPAETARELKTKGHAHAQQFELATVLFTDFKDFTQLTQQLSATDLVTALDICFKTFDAIVAKYNIEKIKTIGDSYMAAGGIPTPSPGSTKNTVLAGLEMAVFIRTFQAEADGSRIPFEMRVGIHTGPVVAGIVGAKKFQYDVWGDTVNTASRMEDAGEVGKVNISQATFELIKDDPQFRFEPRGKVEAKGKGMVEMYFVELAFV